MLNFSPSVGIVGTRELRVASIRDRDKSVSPNRHEYVVGEWLDFIVTTPAGELVLRFPLEVGDAAAQVLSHRRKLTRSGQNHRHAHSSGREGYSQAGVRNT